MALILNSAGKPEPSPEIQRRLRYIHPGLHLRYIEAIGAIWAVCTNWTDQDRRWERVQSGEVGAEAAYDIVGYLPLGCNVDEAPSHLERVFREYPSADAKKFIDNIDEYNRMPAQVAAEEAIAEVLDSPNPEGKAPAIISVPARRSPRKKTSKYLD